MCATQIDEGGLVWLRGFRRSVGPENQLEARLVAPAIATKALDEAKPGECVLISKSTASYRSEPGGGRS